VLHPPAWLLIGSVVIARRRSGLRLHLEADLRNAPLAQGRGHRRGGAACLGVTSRGSRPVTIQAIDCSFRFPDRKLTWTPPVHRLTTALPVTLADGRLANFVQPIEAFVTSLGAVLHEPLAGRAGRIRSHVVADHVIARGVERFSAPLEPALRRDLLRIARSVRATSAGTAGPGTCTGFSRGRERWP
jgi:hypothetical protein